MFPCARDYFLLSWVSWVPFILPRFPYPFLQPVPLSQFSPSVQWQKGKVWLEKVRDLCILAQFTFFSPVVLVFILLMAIQSTSLFPCHSPLEVDFTSHFWDVWLPHPTLTYLSDSSSPKHTEIQLRCLHFQLLAAHFHLLSHCHLKTNRNKSRLIFPLVTLEDQQTKPLYSFLI